MARPTPAPTGWTSDHPLLQQLRALPVPGEGHPAVRHQPARRGPVPLYGDGGNVRDWLHVDDHCRGIQLAARARRARRDYHIGGGAELTNQELTAALLEAAAPAGTWSTRSRTARATTGATRWTTRRCGRSATHPQSRSPTGWPRPSLVCRQPRMVGAAEAADAGAAPPQPGGIMTSWLVTGAGGMLGRDLVTWPPAQRRRRHRAEPGQPRHH